MKNYEKLLKYQLMASFNLSSTYVQIGNLCDRREVLAKIVLKDFDNEAAKEEIELINATIKTLFTL